MTSYVKIFHIFLILAYCKGFNYVSNQKSNQANSDWLFELAAEQASSDKEFRKINQKSCSSTLSLIIFVVYFNPVADQLKTVPNQNASKEELQKYMVEMTDIGKELSNLEANGTLSNTSGLSL
ncbi:hypothetical protein CHUAL_012285 [Chamberlinius hualienensis]